MRIFSFIGAVSAFVAVAAGAFGAHALKTRLSPEMLAIWETGAHYHLMHSVVLLFVGLLPPNRASRFSGWLFLAGIIFFAGSLYALALSSIKVLGAVTPLGGICFLAGWVALAVSVRATGEDGRA